MAGSVSFGQLTRQLEEARNKKTEVTQAIETNEQRANEIQAQVARTTADEEQQAQLYDIIQDNENRDVASASDNHNATLNNLQQQRAALQKPEAPADDADDQTKAQYQADLEAYNRESAILDDEFKAENRRYEEELKQIQEKARQDKKDTQDKINELVGQISQLQREGEQNRAQIEDLQQQILTAREAIATAETEIENARQAERAEDARLKDETSGGIDGNVETSRRDERRDNRADRRALRAVRSDIRDMDGVSNVRMDRSRGTITYTDANGQSHTVTASGTGRGDQASYTVQDTRIDNGNGESYTGIFDFDFNGDNVIGEQTGYIARSNDGTTIGSHNEDGTYTRSRVEGGRTTSIVYDENLRVSQQATVTTSEGSTTTEVTDGGNTTRTEVTTNPDGSETRIQHNPDGSRTEVTTNNGTTTTVTYSNDGKKTDETVEDGNGTTHTTYNENGQPETEVRGNSDNTRVVTSNYENGQKKDGDIVVDGHTQHITYDENGNAFTSTNVKFNESIDDVLTRMGYDKNASNYNEIRAAFVDANQTRTTKKGTQYFLAGQEVRVPVDVDTFTPTESSTTAVDGKAESARWRDWHNQQQLTRFEASIRDTYAKGKIYYQESSRTHYKKEKNGQYTEIKFPEGYSQIQVNSDGTYYATNAEGKRVKDRLPDKYWT